MPASSTNGHGAPTPLTAQLLEETGPPHRMISGGSAHSSGAGSVLIARPYGLESPHLPKKIPTLPGATDIDIAETLQLSGVEPVKSESAPFWRRLLAFTGPGWLMSIAYVDPGNLEADLQTGAQFGYTLLWALLFATIMGLCMQLVAARLGCATGRHLAEHCREHYNFGARVVLWGLVELAIIGSDIQEVIGCSIGLQMLLGLPLSAGVLLTAAAAFGFLFLERFGARKLELFFGVLIAVLALSMGGIFTVISPDKAAMVNGLLVPEMPSSAVQQVVGMVGCVVMPHNLFLHSALVQSRVIESGEEREAIFLFTVESSLAIFTSLLINMSVVAIFAKGFYGSPGADKIGLRNAGFFLGQAYGDALRVIWALGLCAAGQSSTMTGAYAGQWVMQGYLNLKVQPWKRAIITRGMALVPTLMVAVYFGGGHSGLDALNGYLNVLQSLVLPFAVVPLLVFAGSRYVMGDLVLGMRCLVGLWFATGLVMAVNVYLFWSQFGEYVSPGFLIAAAAVYTAGIAYVGLVPRRSEDAASIDRAASHATSRN